MQLLLGTTLASSRLVTHDSGRYCTFVLSEFYMLGSFSVEGEGIKTDQGICYAMQCTSFVPAPSIFKIVMVAQDISTDFISRR